MITPSNLSPLVSFALDHCLEVDDHIKEWELQVFSVIDQGSQTLNLAARHIATNLQKGQSKHSTGHYNK